MKTILENFEYDFIQSLCKNDINNKNSFFKIVYRGELFQKEKKESFFEKFNNKYKEFFNNSIVLFESKGYYFFGKIDKFFWFMDECENIYLVSKNIIDIPIQITRLTSYWDLDVDENLDEFWKDRQFQYPEKGNVKDIYDSFKLMAKQHGYEFDLMKDIDDYEGVKDDVVEFNQLLTSYGIVNKEE